MISFSAICAIAASLIAASNSLLYLLKTLKREVKPHCFTWLVWGMLMLISGFAMLSVNAGFAGYAMILCGAFCSLVGIFAIFYGEKNITPKDKVSLFLSILAIVLWQTTNNPSLAILSTTFAGLMGYYPTFRKSFYDPYNENPSAFLIYMLADSLIILSVKEYSLAATLYPASIFTANLSLAILILFRRKQINSNSH